MFPFAPENWSRETCSAVPSRVSPTILLTQSEYVAYSRSPPRFPHFPRRFPSKQYRQPPSCQSRAKRVTQLRTDTPRNRRHRARSPQRSLSDGPGVVHPGNNPVYQLVRNPYFLHPLLAQWVCAVERVSGMRYVRRPSGAVYNLPGLRGRIL